MLDMVLDVVAVVLDMIIIICAVKIIRKSKKD